MRELLERLFWLVKLGNLEKLDGFFLKLFSVSRVSQMLYTHKGKASSNIIGHFYKKGIDQSIDLL